MSATIVAVLVVYKFYVRQIQDSVSLREDSENVHIRVFGPVWNNFRNQIVIMLNSEMSICHYLYHIFVVL